MLYSHVAFLMLRLLNVVSHSGVRSTTANMRMAHIAGDVQLGCLLPIHRQITSAEGCGEIWEQYGIHRTEIALRTIRNINDEGMLPFRLGISIRDSCWTESIAMEQTIAFIRDVIGHDNSQCCLQDSNDCRDQQTQLVALVGPGKSATTIAVQNLLQVFHIPQIGYSATSTDLSDKKQFGYFLRVVPSDVWQARAMVEIVKHFGWTYVAVVYSAGNYGEKGFEELHNFIDMEQDICIAISHKIKSLAPTDEFDQLLLTFSRTRPRPQVAICFCEGTTIKNIFRAVKRTTGEHKRLASFQWIGSDGWADRHDVVDGVEAEAMGSFSMRIHSPKVDSFDVYYFALTPETNRLNPWFREFWQQKFQCRLMDKSDKGDSPDLTPCTGDESLADNYEQDPKLSQVINTIRTVASALLSMHRQICGVHFQGLCSAMIPINGTLLFRHLINVTFVDQFSQDIYFDSNGDPPAWYDILNYQGKSGFINAGEFKQYREGLYRLNISVAELIFYDKSTDIPVSVCSHTCDMGQIRKVQRNKCCWHCISCDLNAIVVDLFTCENCPLACHILQVEYLRWFDPMAIFAMIFACLGSCCTLFTLFVFVRHNTTPVVKSTTRELSYIILVGLLTCYVVTFVIIASPSTYTCFGVRTVPGLAFAMIYGALLTKTNRIARILAGSKKRILIKKPRFLSIMSQVAITCLLVSVELCIVAAAVVYEPPQADYNPLYLPRRMVLVCRTSWQAFLAPFVWDSILISLCTLYAVKTRNLPENFNEAKFIGFTMYTTCIIWLAFITIYFGSPNKAITMCLSFSLTATVVLVLLFLPKLCIILVHPEKNVRASYATTKVIRCHFGPTISTTGAGSFEAKTINRTQSSKTLIKRMSTRSSMEDSVESDPGLQTTSFIAKLKENEEPMTKLSVIQEAAQLHSKSQSIGSQTDNDYMFLSERTDRLNQLPRRIVRKRAKFGGKSTDEISDQHGMIKMDGDVHQLMESCRRQQEQKMLKLHGSRNSSSLRRRSAQTYLELFDRPVILPISIPSNQASRTGISSTEHLNSMLVSTIDNSFRALIGAVESDETKEDSERRSSNIREFQSQSIDSDAEFSNDSLRRIDLSNRLRYSFRKKVLKNSAQKNSKIDSLLYSMDHDIASSINHTPAMQQQQQQEENEQDVPSTIAHSSINNLNLDNFVQKTPNDEQSFQQLLHVQGLKATDLTESALV